MFIDLLKRRILLYARTIVLLSIVPLGSSPARATLVPQFDLGTLINNSETIVVGRTVSVGQGQRTTIRVQNEDVQVLAMTAEVAVREVLKGNVAGPNLMLHFFVPLTTNGFPGIPADQFGIFFLRGGPRTWSLADPYHPYLPSVPGATVSHGSPVERVISELAHCIRSADASSQTKREAVESLGTLTTVEATAALEAVANGRDIAPRALAIASLLGQGRAEWIEPASEILVAGLQGLEPYAVWRLCGAIESIELRLRDPKPIPALARLLHVSDVTVRRAAAAALRGTRNTAAIGPLIEALQDNNRDVQYQALMGLAETTGVTGEWAPAVGPYQQDPDRYVNHWREWAKSGNPFRAK